MRGPGLPGPRVFRSLSTWCGVWDLNPHVLTNTGTSSLPVCQFQQPRIQRLIIITDSHCLSRPLPLNLPVCLSYPAGPALMISQNVPSSGGPPRWEYFALPPYTITVQFNMEVVT